MRLAVALGAGLGSAALLTAGALVIAGIPGEHQVTDVGFTVKMDYTGSSAVDIAVMSVDGAGPASNAFRAKIVCTSEGAFTVSHPRDSDGADGLEFECGSGAGMTPVGKPVWLTEQFLVAGNAHLDVTTNPETTWTVTVQFVNSVTTPWGVNAKGETYGVSNENGTPDLSPALASNCEFGYIYFTDVMPPGGDENKEPHSIPVYKSDGETVVGEFWIGNNMPFCDQH
jgi:hypothetical protein